MEKTSKILNRKFFQRHPAVVARELLGCYLVKNYRSKKLIGKIVETEAYLSTPDDPASHGYKPQSKRTTSLFGEAGHAYVTNIHRYMILNVVTETRGHASAVLIRAVEPTDGIETMKRLRNKENLRDLTTGPGKLAMAFNITRALDGADVCQPTSDVFFQEKDETIEEIKSGPRIGISQAQELPLRFYLSGNPYVSGPQKNNP